MTLFAEIQKFFSFCTKLSVSWGSVNLKKNIYYISVMSYYISMMSYYLLVSTVLPGSLVTSFNLLCKALFSDSRVAIFNSNSCWLDTTRRIRIHRNIETKYSRVLTCSLGLFICWLVWQALCKLYIIYIHNIIILYTCCKGGAVCTETDVSKSERHFGTEARRVVSNSSLFVFTSPTLSITFHTPDNALYNWLNIKI